MNENIKIAKELVKIAKELMAGNLNRNVWEGWTPQHFIDELEPEIDLIMNNRSWVKPFKNKAELAAYCKDHQPYYKKNVPEVVSYFCKKYGIR